MSKPSKGIEVWVRVRPAKKPSKEMELVPEDGKIEFKFTKDGLKNLDIRQDFYGFQFNGILDMLTR
jgi:hypothetical protein